MSRMPGALAPIAVAGLELADLVGLAVDLARARELWRPKVQRGDGKRWYMPLLADDHTEAWLLGWPAGGRIELHDHGGSSGAFCVVKGRLVETFARPGDDHLRQRRLRAGWVVGFGPDHIHDVTNSSHSQALSIHVYSPRLTTMTFYDHRSDGRLEAVRTEITTTP
jgi:predicted metal-dependent enzyme (double-stranded beta helix superfamily)